MRSRDFWCPLQIFAEDTAYNSTGTQKWIPYSEIFRAGRDFFLILEGPGQIFGRPVFQIGVRFRKTVTFSVFWGPGAKKPVLTPKPEKVTFLQKRSKTAGNGPKRENTRKSGFLDPKNRVFSTPRDRTPPCKKARPRKNHFLRLDLPLELAENGAF